MEMTKSQLEGMIKFHTRTERAYRASGQVEMADAAKAMKETLEAEYNARFSSL